MNIYPILFLLAICYTTVGYLWLMLAYMYQQSTPPRSLVIFWCIFWIILMFIPVHKLIWRK